MPKLSPKKPPRRTPKPRPAPNFQLVRTLTTLGYERIVGVDEVGRGALAGPLVVAAVELSKKIIGITDSKLIKATERLALAQAIHQAARQIRFGWASPAEIDTFGLTKATELAYQRALAPMTADVILTDFVRLPGRKYISQPKGDRYFYPTAAASIVAKVYRDQLMRVYHQFQPCYGWHTNVGYGTAEHIAAINTHGPSNLHRRQFIKKVTE